ncbi:hypothetical protein RSAG8_10215, partial [Rhizoctonia solani AG-8 WAC10335]
MGQKDLMLEQVMAHCHNLQLLEVLLDHDGAGYSWDPPELLKIHLMQLLKM